MFLRKTPYRQNVTIRAQFEAPKTISFLEPNDPNPCNLAETKRPSQFAESQGAEEVHIPTEKLE